MLTGGQMRRLLQKPGRTTGNAMTPPLWTISRHASRLFYLQEVHAGSRFAFHFSLRCMSLYCGLSPELISSPADMLPAYCHWQVAALQDDIIQ